MGNCLSEPRQETEGVETYMNHNTLPKAAVGQTAVHVSCSASCWGTDLGMRLTGPPARPPAPKHGKPLSPAVACR